MKENVIQCYEHIDEDGRLTYNNVRRVEYETNRKYILELIKPGMRVAGLCLWDRRICV